MIISLVRIDDRLIHGQVATDWVRYTHCDRIIVINDLIAMDEIRKKLLLAITPAGVKTSIITIGKAIEAYNNPKYKDLNAMFLLTCPQDILSLIEGGVSIKSINIGGMSYKEGKKQITAAVSVSDDDISCFNELYKKGIELEIRMLSTERKVNWMEVAN